jgi:hypothetical protein
VGLQGARLATTPLQSRLSRLDHGGECELSQFDDIQVDPEVLAVFKKSCFFTKLTSFLFHLPKMPSIFLDPGT